MAVTFTPRGQPIMRYSVYQASAGGGIRIAEIDADSDRDALRQAREILDDGPGELRENGRIVGRFGRGGGFLLQR